MTDEMSFSHLKEIQTLRRTLLKWREEIAELLHYPAHKRTHRGLQYE
jgi:hypothetical protein